MANNIVIHCPQCGQSTKYVFFPKPQQLGAATPNQFKEFNSTVEYLGDDDIAPTHVVNTSFWQSDGAKYSLAASFAGGVILVFGWYYQLDAGAYVAGSMLLVGIGLHFAKIILHAPPKPKQKEAIQTIQVEVSEQEPGGHWAMYLDEFEPGVEIKKIKMADLKKAAKAHYEDKNHPHMRCISRWSLVQQGLSQSKANLVLSEFTRLNYCFVTKGNKRYLTPRCLAMLRKISQ